MLTIAVCDDALAYLDFPYAHHRRLRTNNVQERANRELKRRSRVVQVFPSRKSLIRMLGAVFSEMDEDWATRRWFTEESIAQALAPAKPTAPAPAYEGTAEEHARRIIDSEMDEDWATRRWFTEESIAQALAPAKPTAPAPAYEGTAEEHARRIIDVVIADNPIGRKAA